VNERLLFGGKEKVEMKFFLCVLGLVFIVEGMPYFLLPAKMKQFLAQIHEMPDDTLRVMGLVAMLMGAFIVYLGTR
jgi:hypothetical protein